MGTFFSNLNFNIKNKKQNCLKSVTRTSDKPRTIFSNERQFYRELNFKHSNENRQAELIHQYILFRVFLPIREATVDSPVITSVAPTVQLLQSDQSHVIWGQTWNTVLGGWAQVDPVEATTTDVRNSLVAVGFSVPCVPAVLLLAETLPYVTDARGKTHLGHLLRSPHWHQCDIERLLYFTAKNMILTLYWKKKMFQSGT